VGGNFRLDSIQAAIVLVKLKYLESWHEARQRNAAYYDERFAACDAIETPCVEPHNQYLVPLHLQECFADIGHKEGDFPQSERAAREVLALPIYPELTREQLDAVSAAVLQALGASWGWTGEGVEPAEG